MRFRLIPRFLLFAGLCVCLTSGKLWLRQGLAAQRSQIVFTSKRDGNLEIYVMDNDGTNQRRLTAVQGDDNFPDWSPDGTKIAFNSNRNGGFVQIYVMDSDGKNLIRLTDGLGERYPDWSPDGRKIAFSVDDREDHIAVMDADGKNREKLEDKALYPSWSPDGKQIAFVAPRDGGSEIYVIGVDGQERKRVTHDLVRKWSPSFSPDGQRIAHMAEHKGFYHIHVVAPDGRNLQRLTHNEENHWDPAWSPDGQVIAYYVWDGILEGEFHGTIHLMASNGRYIRQLSDGRNARDSEPDISPLELAVSPTSTTTTTWGRLKKNSSSFR